MGSEKARVGVEGGKEGQAEATMGASEWEEAEAGERPDHRRGESMMGALGDCSWMEERVEEEGQAEVASEEDHESAESRRRGTCDCCCCAKRPRES